MAGGCCRNMSLHDAAIMYLRILGDKYLSQSLTLPMEGAMGQQTVHAIFDHQFVRHVVIFFCWM